MQMQHAPAELYVRKLEKIVAEKPWFAIAQQLLSIEIKRTDKIDFEQYLHKVAIYSLDREVFYDKLFYSPQSNRLQEINIEKIEHETEVSEKETETEKITEAAATEKQIEDTEKPIQEAETEKSQQETETEKQIFDYPVADYFGDIINETSNDIIEKFLASPQKIIVKPSNGEIIEDVKIKESETFDNDDFVTETLAKIYAEQGYISRAIEIYKKLSLQDSKKSTYFATLIENLRKRN
jgi:hypothetical protein